jgi:Tfp pilus assembly protein FimT
MYELLMVAMVVAILSMMAIPLVGSVSQQLRLRGAAWQVAGDLRLARQRAVTLRTRMRVCLSSCAVSVPSGTYSVEIDRGSPSSPHWASETGTIVRLPRDVNISASATATFASTGMASGSTFTLSNAVGTYQITVNPTGQVRVCRGSCT